MTGWVQVVVAGNVTEAEEVQSILAAAGIETELESAVEEHPGEHGDQPMKVLVLEEHVDAARDAIEALTEPDEIATD